MKRHSPWFHFTLFISLAVSPLWGQDPPNPPMGMLGLPLGTFAVIEGTEHKTGMFEGSSDFVIEVVNGKKWDDDRRIVTDWPSDFSDKRVAGKRYVLHGYETGAWNGVPSGLPQYGQSGGFFFDHVFVVTSVEKIDGKTVADAKPLDPDFLLAEPNPKAKPDDSCPMGRLGATLGTVVTLKVHTPDSPILMESPFQVDAINGKPPVEPLYISIPGVHETKSGSHVFLRGFESGVWGSLPPLPESEDASKGAEVQQPFQFFAKFVVAGR